MALIVFLRGVNVGGHRTFKPSVLARELAEYDVVNIGAAGTFVARKQISQAKLRAEIQNRLPFKADIMICGQRDLIDLASVDPFAKEPSGPDITRFVSILAKRPSVVPALPIVEPPDGQWLLRVIAIRGRFVLGLYRRQMKAIGYLGQIEKRLGISATTRNWNTIATVVRILKGSETSDSRKAGYG